MRHCAARIQVLRRMYSEAFCIHGGIEMLDLSDSVHYHLDRVQDLIKVLEHEEDLRVLVTYKTPIDPFQSG